MTIDVGVLVGVAGLLALVFYWSGRYGDRQRGAGTSLRRGSSAHTTSRGQPKKAYATRAEAAGRAHAMMKRDGEPMNVYQCPTCAKWHVGHER
ncbi:MAG TPA: hypothetical protein VNF05_10385 [Acidimicrobiales bacterium]|nr:hypothetical protein [Acidimicrobiales bacterium]